MKSIAKKLLPFFFLTIVPSFIPKTYAAYGSAKDADLFALAIIGFLLLVTGVFFLIDYLRENGMFLIGKLFHLF